MATAWSTTSHRDEWVWWPDREACGYRARTAVGVYSDYAPAATHPYTGAETQLVFKRRVPDAAEKAPSAGVYLGRTTHWIMPSVALPEGVTARPGDLLRDSDDIDHTILKLHTGKFRLTYWFETIALAVENDLDASGTLSRPTGGQDAAGRQALVTALYSTIATVACRVQPQDSAGEDVLGRRTLPLKYTAYLASPVSAKAKDRFTVSGTSYTVLGFHDPERLDALMSLDLELIT